VESSGASYLTDTRASIAESGATKNSSLMEHADQSPPNNAPPDPTHIASNTSLSRPWKWQESPTTSPSFRRASKRTSYSTRDDLEQEVDEQKVSRYR
jgi:hypothetical protein